MDFDNFNMKQKILFYVAAYTGVLLIVFIYAIAAVSTYLFIKNLIA